MYIYLDSNVCIRGPFRRFYAYAFHFLHVRHAITANETEAAKSDYVSRQRCRPEPCATASYSVWSNNKGNCSLIHFLALCLYAWILFVCFFFSLSLFLSYNFLHPFFSFGIFLSSIAIQFVAIHSVMPILMGFLWTENECRRMCIITSPSLKTLLRASTIQLYEKRFVFIIWRSWNVYFYSVKFGEKLAMMSKNALRNKAHSGWMSAPNDRLQWLADNHSQILQWDCVAQCASTCYGTRPWRRIDGTKFILRRNVARRPA